MGRYHEDGYSADVEGFLVVRGGSYRLAKSNGCTFVLADPCELAPGTSGELRVIVDGRVSSRMVEIPTGVAAGKNVVQYKVAAPF